MEAEGAALEGVSKVVLLALRDGERKGFDALSLGWLSPEQAVFEVAMAFDLGERLAVSISFEDGSELSADVVVDWVEIDEAAGTRIRVSIADDDVRQALRSRLSGKSATGE